MGTNFYHRPDPCPTCGRFEELHIGKRSAGWEFTFRGYRDTGGPDSRAAWEAFLGEAGGEILDEYGDVYTSADFFALVDITRTPYHGRRPRRHAADYPDDDVWIDPYGWSFTGREFS